MVIRNQSDLEAAINNRVEELGSAMSGKRATEHVTYTNWERYTSGAVLSPCEKYRYVLWRRWSSFPFDERRYVAFVGLNPSTADAVDDDATIRRCTGFAKRWGFDGLLMLNLFAFRATHPHDLWMADDPIGSANDWHILQFAQEARQIVVCWGNGGGSFRQRTAELVKRARSVDKSLRSIPGAAIVRFGLTKSKQPLHPVRLPYNRPLEAAV